MNRNAGSNFSRSLNTMISNHGKPRCVGVKGSNPKIVRTSSIRFIGGLCREELRLYLFKGRNVEYYPKRVRRKGLSYMWILLWSFPVHVGNYFKTSYFVFVRFVAVIRYTQLHNTHLILRPSWHIDPYQDPNQGNVDGIFVPVLRIYDDL